MKVFTEKIEDCFKCKFYNDEYNYCNFTNLPLTDLDWSRNQIHKSCPFNKSLTKEDIESFGFKYLAKDDENRQTYIKSNTYLLYKDDIVQMFNDLSTSFQIVLDECTITSKPHLKFILQTLNIIK